MTATKKQSKQVRCPHCGHKAEHQPTEIVHGGIDDLKSVAGLRCAKCGGNFEEATALRGRNWIDEPLEGKAMSAAGISLAETAAAIDTLRASTGILHSAVSSMGESVKELRTMVRGILERETERKVERERDPWTKFKDMVKRLRSKIIAYAMRRGLR